MSHALRMVRGDVLHDWTVFRRCMGRIVPEKIRTPVVHSVSPDNGVVRPVTIAQNVLGTDEKWVVRS